MTFKGLAFLCFASILLGQMIDEKRKDASRKYQRNPSLGSQRRVVFGHECECISMHHNTIFRDFFFVHRYRLFVNVVSTRKGARGDI